jgi:hypothetical protein
MKERTIEDLMAEPMRWSTRIQTGIAELERTIADRRRHVATHPGGDLLYRLDAMEQALGILRVADAITYYETNGTPVTPIFSKHQTT